MAVAPGSRIGFYEVVSPIGAGGMGEVYRARDTRLNRDVALKIVPESFALDADRLARFKREAQVLASLNHPNIGAIYGFEDSNGTQALVLELVDGPTLADRIAQGPIPLDEALSIAKQIAEALEAAHEQGIIHRDLKPANITLRPDGTVKVLDFGLAKALTPETSGPPSSLSNSPTITSPVGVTGVGILLGTAAYMSPEQARGKPVDKRADIWAFGCVIYEMLSGKKAFDGEDITETLAAVVRGEPRWEALPEAIPARIRHTIRVCLQKDPKQRVGDIAAIRLAMDGVFDDAAALPITSSVKTRWSVPAVAALTVGAVLFTALAAWMVRPSPAATTPTRFEIALPEGALFRNTGRTVLALSPDGQQVLYNTSRGVYLRRMGALDATLVQGTERGLTDPVFSPDGEWIGYLQDNQLKRVAVKGGTPVSIASTRSTMGISWASDDTILFAAAEGIMRVPGSGGEPQLLIPAMAGETFYGPQLLPGGDGVLFSVTTSTGNGRWDHGSVVVQSIRSSERFVLVRGGSDARYIRTGHLIYATGNTLFAVPYDLRARAVSGTAMPVVQDVIRATAQAANSASANYAIADNGTLVYVPMSGFSTSRSLVWVSREGPTIPVDTIAPRGFGTPRLSPDGTRVLVEADDQLWIYELDTGRSRRFADSAERGAWEPSGTRVAYSSNRSGSMEAWLQPVDGGEARQLTHLGGSVHVDSWSPDGKLLTVHHHAAGLQVDMFVIRVDDPHPEPRSLVKTEFPEEGAAFSPDARYFAYSAVEGRQREIYLRPYPGPGAQHTVSVGGGQSPVWSPTGELFYRSLTGDRLFAVPVATQPALKIGAARQVAAGNYYMNVGGSSRPQYDVTPDGKRFLMLVNSTPTGAVERARLVAVLNWFEELKRRVSAN